MSFPLKTNTKLISYDRNKKAVINNTVSGGIRESTNSNKSYM
jgi:hypothetical protein